MAVATASYFSGSIVGEPQQGADIDIYESSSNPKYALGFGFTRADGNKYRYCHFGALTNRGTLVSADVSESNLAKIENVGALVANITKRAGEIFNPNAVGSRYLQLVITATAQQFEGGYLTVTTGAGAGFTYRIKGHTTTSDNNPVTGNIYADIDSPLVVAIDSTSDITIQGSPYANLEAVSTTDTIPAGVTVSNNTAAAYGWICTNGVVGVLQDVNIGTIGKPCFVSSNTAGAIQCKQSATSSTTNELVLPIVGYMLEAGSSADYSIIKLQLE